MYQVVLKAESGPVTAPEQLKEWVVAHPVQVRRYVYLDDLLGSLAELVAEWTAAAAASKSKEVREFVRLILADFTELLGLDR